MISTPPIAETNTNGKVLSLPTLTDQVDQFRKKLLDEAGLNIGPPSHFQRPKERPFLAKDRDHTTLLFGGLTMRHEQLIHAGLEGLGYKVAVVPTPNKRDFQAGKEYGNNGQCNPTYFTVGSLVNHLKHLRDEEGIPTERIMDDYIFLTAGACGPCRFGMYEAEYRLALRNSGFDGFRVILFQQSGGLDQTDLEAGLELNLNFFLTLINAFFMGDVLNGAAFHIRPYETTPGQTDEVMEACLNLCKDRLRRKQYDKIKGGLIAKILQKKLPFDNPHDVQKFIDQLFGPYYQETFRECARLIDEKIEVDYTLPKPIVKITGEFWAQTTEGDGNFHMFKFLESEGSEVLVEPVATWIAYLLSQARMLHHDRHGLGEDEAPPKRWELRKRWKHQKSFLGKSMILKLAEKVITREYDRLRISLGGSTHELINQQHLMRLGHPYYNSRSGGGEGHLEVAKNIYYTNKSLAHMVLSLKPFGCMPSTQSDGAQAAVISDYPDMIYLPVETSGEGDINAYSRVQMSLGEAKVKTKEEFKACVKRTGYSLEQIRAYTAQHAELRRPLLDIPHQKGVIGRAANFVLLVGSLMDRNGHRALKPCVTEGSEVN